MTKKLFLTTIVLSLLLGITRLNAQGLGGHPGDVDWQEIDTKH